MGQPKELIRNYPFFKTNINNLQNFLYLWDKIFPPKEQIALCDILIDVFDVSLFLSVETTSVTNMPSAKFFKKIFPETLSKWSLIKKLVHYFY